MISLLFLEPSSAECHNPVVLKTNIIIREVGKQAVRKHFSYEGTNWDKLREAWTNEINWIPVTKHRDLTMEETDELINTVAEAVVSVANENVRKVTFRGTDYGPLPEKTRKLLSRRRAAVKEKRRAKDQNKKECKQFLKEHIKELTKDINKGINTHLKDRLAKMLREIKLNHHMFPQIKKFCGSKRIDRPLLVNDEIISLDWDKAESFKAKYENLYEEVVPNNELIEEIKETRERSRLWEISEAEEDEFLAVTREELEDIRKKLNNKKSAGKDGLSNKLIKNLPLCFWEISRIIMNSCLRTGSEAMERSYNMACCKEC